MDTYTNGRAMDESPVPNSSFNKDLNTDASNALFELEKGLLSVCIFHLFIYHPIYSIVLVLNSSGHHNNPNLLPQVQKCQNFYHHALKKNTNLSKFLNCFKIKISHSFIQLIRIAKFKDRRTMWSHCSAVVNFGKISFSIVG